MSNEAHVFVGRPGYKPARSYSEEPCPFCGEVVVEVSRVSEDVTERGDAAGETIIWGFADCMIHECVRCGASLTVEVEP